MAMIWFNAQNTIHNYTIEIQQSSNRIGRLQSEMKSKDRIAIVYIILIATIFDFGCIISTLVVVYSMQIVQELISQNRAATNSEPWLDQCSKLKVNPMKQYTSIYKPIGTRRFCIQLH